MATEPKSKRRHISLQKQLEAALRQLGFEPHELELDHDPALQLRAVNPVTGETDPPHDDPRYLVWRPKAEHLAKTTGRMGESKLSKRGGDISEIAKVKRLERQEQEFRQRVLSRALAQDEIGTPSPVKKAKRSWPKRSFASQRKPDKRPDLNRS